MDPRLRSLAVGGLLAAASVGSACSLTTAFDGLSDGNAVAGDHHEFEGGARDGQTGGGGDDDDTDSSVTPGDDDGGTVGDDDASPPPEDAQTNPTDASGGSDTSINPPDTGTTTFCTSLSPKPLFCADFDEGSVSTGWDQVTSQKGTASLSTTTSTSAPASLKVDTVSISSNQVVDCAGYKLFPTLLNKALTMTLAFDVRFETTDSKADAVIGSIQLNSTGGATYEIQVDVAAATNGDMIVDVPELTTSSGGNETYVDHTLSKRLTPQVWHHLVLTETAPASSGSGTLAVTIDGASAFSGSINVLVSNWVPEVIIGTSYIASPSSAWSVRYDNVTFDAK